MNALNRDLKKLTHLVEKQEATKVGKDPYRLAFHLMPLVGWLNDPNGLCEMNGVYHVFYQYAPFEVTGGLKFWGHYSSQDLLQWVNHGTALYADQPYDCHGVYSGSALVDEEGMHVFYTGNVKQLGAYDYVNTGREHNTIYAYSKDGLHFEEKMCLLRNSDYPEDMTCHIRDPKVWKENDSYYMILGARTVKDEGCVLVYQSEDMKQWTFTKRLSSEAVFGYMWECPDLFRLGDTTLLLISPQGIDAEGYAYQNVYQSGYYVVEGDWKSETYELRSFKELDRGFDFYAPQTFEDSKGRRILIGWMGLPDIEDEYSNPTVEAGWQHALTVPRVMTMQGGKLHQYPVEELEMLRGAVQQDCLSGTRHYSVTKTFDLVAECRDATSFEIKIHDSATLVYDQRAKCVTLQFEENGYGRTSRSVEIDRVTQLRILVDTSSIEVFLNEGEEVFTTRFYPTGEGLAVTSEAEMKLSIWEMGAYKVEDECME